MSGSSSQRHQRGNRLQNGMLGVGKTLDGAQPDIQLQLRKAVDTVKALSCGPLSQRTEGPTKLERQAAVLALDMLDACGEVTRQLKISPNDNVRLEVDYLAPPDLVGIKNRARLLGAGRPGRGCENGEESQIMSEATAAQAALEALASTINDYNQSITSGRAGFRVDRRGFAEFLGTTEERITQARLWATGIAVMQQALTKVENALSAASRILQQGSQQISPVITHGLFDVMRSTQAAGDALMEMVEQARSGNPDQTQRAARTVTAAAQDAKRCCKIPGVRYHQAVLDSVAKLAAEWTISRPDLSDSLNAIELGAAFEKEIAALSTPDQVRNVIRSLPEKWFIAFGAIHGDPHTGPRLCKALPMLRRSLEEAQRHQTEDGFRLLMRDVVDAEPIATIFGDYRELDVFAQDVKAAGQNQMINFGDSLRTPGRKVPQEAVKRFRERLEKLAQVAPRPDTLAAAKASDLATHLSALAQATAWVADMTYDAHVDRSTQVAAELKAVAKRARAIAQKADVDTLAESLTRRICAATSAANQGLDCAFEAAKTAHDGRHRCDGSKCKIFDAARTVAERSRSACKGLATAAFSLAEAMRFCLEGVEGKQELLESASQYLSEIDGLAREARGVAHADIWTARGCNQVKQAIAEAVQATETVSVEANHLRKMAEELSRRPSLAGAIDLTSAHAALIASAPARAAAVKVLERSTAPWSLGSADAHYGTRSLLGARGEVVGFRLGGAVIVKAWKVRGSFEEMKKCKEMVDKRFLLVPGILRLRLHKITPDMIDTLWIRSLMVDILAETVRKVHLTVPNESYDSSRFERWLRRTRTAVNGVTAAALVIKAQEDDHDYRAFVRTCKYSLSMVTNDIRYKWVASFMGYAACKALIKDILETLKNSSIGPSRTDLHASLVNILVGMMRSDEKGGWFQDIGTPLGAKLRLLYDIPAGFPGADTNWSLNAQAFGVAYSALLAFCMDADLTRTRNAEKLEDALRLVAATFASVGNTAASAPKTATNTPVEAYSDPGLKSGSLGLTGHVSALIRGGTQRHGAKRQKVTQASADRVTAVFDTLLHANTGRVRIPGYYATPDAELCANYNQVATEVFLAVAEFFARIQGLGGKGFTS